MISAAWLLSNSIITPQQNVWVAYSGGVDSHALLDLVIQCFKNVRAIHINHNLSHIDTQWQEHCQTVCAALNIPLLCITVDANPNGSQSPEEAARIARRMAWREVLNENDVLLVAHHADDQAETVLFRLLRGSGPKGLSGIKAISKVGQATLWRPLLGVSKSHLLEYATANNLNWLQDKSNFNDKYDRNYLRKHVIPVMLNRWPAAIENINRAAKLCGQLEEFIAPQITQALAKISDKNQVLDLTALRNHSLQWQQEILRAWLQQQNLPPSSLHIKSILKQVVNARVDSIPEYILANKVVRRSQERLYLLEPSMNTKEEYKIAWDLQQPLILPCGTILTVADISDDLKFIDKLKEYEISVQSSHGRKAKKVFQQHAVPPWERAKYPLLFANDRLVCVIGLWCSARI